MLFLSPSSPLFSWSLVGCCCDVVFAIGSSNTVEPRGMPRDVPIEDRCKGQIRGYHVKVAPYVLACSLPSTRSKTSTVGSVWLGRSRKEGLDSGHVLAPYFHQHFCMLCSRRRVGRGCDDELEMVDVTGARGADQDDAQSLCNLVQDGDTSVPARSSRTFCLSACRPLLKLTKKPLFHRNSHILEAVRDRCACCADGLRAVYVALGKPGSSAE